MNVFVTVGTTAFDELFEELASNDFPDSNFTCQTASDMPFSNKLNCFKFTENIEKYIEHADLVICHAGAGTVYQLLEMKKKIIVVPNLIRVDKHQDDLASFVEKNDYGICCRDLKLLKKLILKSAEYIPNKYEKVNFFKGKEISELIELSLAE